MADFDLLERSVMNPRPFVASFRFKAGARRRPPAWMPPASFCSRGSCPARRPRLFPAGPLIVLAAGALLSFAPAGHAASPSATPDWRALRTAVVDLEVFAPGSQTPSRTVGFCVEGVPGIVASYRILSGAERVRVKPDKGDAIETSRCIARDPEHDLLLLDASVPRIRGLSTGSVDLLFTGQAAFALLPPASHDPIIPVPAASQFQAGDLQSMLALAPLAPTGSPLADSLGRVVGMIESIRDQAIEVSFAIPIERALALAAQPPSPGALQDLASIPAAAWTNPAVPEGQQTIGACLARTFQAEKAASYLQRALAGRPQSVAALLEWGMLLQGRGNFDDAEKNYRRALELRPDLPEVYLFLGSCLHVAGFLMKSQEVYAEGLQHAPQAARLHANLGGLYFAQNRNAEAEASFREALRWNPNLGIAHFNLGMLLGAEGRPRETNEVLDSLRAQRSGYAGHLAKALAKRGSALR